MPSGYRSPYKPINERSVAAVLRLLKRYGDGQHVPSKTWHRYGLKSRVEAVFRSRHGGAPSRPEDR